MNSSALRQFWAVVEDTQANLLLKLNDTELTQKLLYELKFKVSLTSEENRTMSAYIHTRTPLIRDLAHARLLARFT